jgi:hypothetical protein
MRQSNRSRRWWVALLVLATTAGGAYAATPASSGGPWNEHNRGRVIHLQEASAQPALTVLDLDKPGPTPGDHVVTTDGLLRDGVTAGSMEQACTMVKAGAGLFASTFDCTGEFALAEGSLTVQGSFVPAHPESSFAITGGTGAFATARGEVILATEADTITIKLA